MNKLILKLRWWLGLYDKSGVTPVTWEALEDMEKRGKMPVNWINKRQKAKPCKHHSLAVSNLLVPEVSRIKQFMRRCERCGWFYKVKEEK